MKKQKNKDKIIIPLFETNPIAEAEEVGEDIETAIEMAKKWVEENKL